MKMLAAHTKHYSRILIQTNWIRPIIAALLLSFCWHSQFAIGLLVLFPACWASSQNRWVGLLFVTTYYLASSWELVPVFNIFFEGQYNFFVAIIAWVTYALLIGLPWLFLFPSKSTSSLSLFILVVVTVMLTAIPPIGAISWVHPITSAGALYPALQLWGLGLTLILMGAVSVTIQKIIKKQPTNKWLVGLISMLLFLSLLANAMYQKQDPPKKWVAINTNLGNWPKTFSGGYVRQIMLIDQVQQAISHNAKMIVLPENIAGIWRNSTKNLWQPVFELARKKDAYIIIGAQQVLDGMKEADGFLLFNPHEGLQFITSNQPMPFGEWNPFSQSSPPTNWHHIRILKADNKNFQVSICFEDLIAWPHIFALTNTTHPDIIVSIANQWFNLHTSYQKQALAVKMWARLQGAALLRAVNS
jgi:apolipoprotein N-acyltransferase